MAQPVRLSPVIGQDYLGQATLRATVVPARAAYLVAQGSRSGIRRAVQEASTRWGGMTEPIVPVSPGGQVDAWWGQVVELAGVDGAVNVDLPQDDAAAAAAALALPLVSLAHIDRSGPVRWTCHPAWLGPPEDSGYAIASSEGPLWQAVAAGDLTDEHLAELDPASLSVWRPRSGEEVGSAQVRGGTLLDRTVAHFAEYAGSNGPWVCPAIVWVVDQDDLLDCIHFWNLRALRPLQLEHLPMLLVPAEDVEHWVGFDRRFAALLSRPDEFSPDVVLQSSSAEESALHRIAGVLSLQPTEEKVRVSRKFPPPPPRQAPFTYRMNLELRHWFVFGRQYGTPTDVDVNLFRAGTRVRFPSPVPFTGGGYSLIRLSGSPFDGLPQRPSVAALVEPSADWHGRSIQLRTNAIREYLFEIHVPSLEDAAQTVLRDVTAGSQLSDKGRLGMALQANTDISTLLTPGMYEAVVELTTPRSRHLLRELRSLRAQGVEDDDLVELAARWGGRTERRYRSAHNLDRADKARALNALEGLCALGWAERGLEINCGECGVRNFVPLSEASVKDQPRCRGCGAAQGYTAEASALSIQYRLDTFVDRASDQGVLPHLLVVAALTRRHPRSSILPGVELLFADGQKAEVDVFGVHDARVLAGEVKARASEFTPDQLARDTELSARLGADIHVLAAMDEIPEETVAAARGLSERAGVELLLLDHQDLRPESPEEDE